MSDIIARAMAADAMDKAVVVDQKVDALPNGIVYKGAVALYVDLPRNPEVGDCYTVINNNNYEYVWGPLEGVNQWIQFGPSDLADVAYSGDYTDLINTPTIPTKTSDLTNDSDFITMDDVQDEGYAKTADLATVATSGSYSDLINKPWIPTVDVNKAYVDAGLAEKQDTLIAGSNISIAPDGKTISAIGGGTEYIAGQGIVIENNTISYDPDEIATIDYVGESISELSSTLQDEIDDKQDILVAGTNISIAADGKTISATDTTYTAGTNITIDEDNVISASGGGGDIVVPPITPSSMYFGPYDNYGNGYISYVEVGSREDALKYLLMGCMVKSIYSDYSFTLDEIKAALGDTTRTGIYKRLLYNWNGNEYTVTDVDLSDTEHLTVNTRYTTACAFNRPKDVGNLIFVGIMVRTGQGAFKDNKLLNIAFGPKYVNSSDGTISVQEGLDNTITKPTNTPSNGDVLATNGSSYFWKTIQTGVLGSADTYTFEDENGTHLQTVYGGAEDIQIDEDDPLYEYESGAEFDDGMFFINPTSPIDINPSVGMKMIFEASNGSETLHLENVDTGWEEEGWFCWVLGSDMLTGDVFLKYNPDTFEIMIQAMDGFNDFTTLNTLLLLYADININPIAMKFIPKDNQTIVDNGSGLSVNLGGDLRFQNNGVSTIYGGSIEEGEPDTIHMSSDMTLGSARGLTHVAEWNTSDIWDYCPTDRSIVYVDLFIDEEDSPSISYDARGEINGGGGLTLFEDRPGDDRFFIETESSGSTFFSIWSDEESIHKDLPAEWNSVKVMISIPSQSITPIDRRFIPGDLLPNIPDNQGTYVLKAIVTSGGKQLQWVAE